MKKSLFILVTVCFNCVVVVSAANAQNASVGTEIRSPKKNITGFENMVLPISDDINDPEVIDPKILKNFAKKYKDASAVSWYKTGRGICADFVSNGVKNYIFYSPRGNWTGSVKGYKEDKFPFDITDFVKRTYYDYTINYIQEVETKESDGIPTYVFYLENKNNFKKVRVYEMEIEVMEAYKK